MRRKRRDGDGQIFVQDGSLIRAMENGKSSSKVLDLADGKDIVLWEVHGGKNQRWVLHADGTIRSEDSDLCFDVEGGSVDDGARVIAFRFHGGANQTFRLKEIPTRSLDICRKRGYTWLGYGYYHGCYHF
jgi:hypothetical protein